MEGMLHDRNYPMVTAALLAKQHRGMAEPSSTRK